MFTRIVKMEFKSEEVINFLSKFDIVKEKIRAFEGCTFLELYLSLIHISEPTRPY